MSEIVEAVQSVSEILPENETDSPSLDGRTVIKVAITETVTIAAPGQEVENEEADTTGSLPSDLSNWVPEN